MGFSLFCTVNKLSRGIIDKKVPLKFTHIVIVLETVGDQIVFVFNMSHIIIASSRYQDAREDILQT